jgi:gliding motility-associated lipoprotein GldD
MKYIFIVFIFCISACESNPPLPKPRAYPRVEYPEKTYQNFDQDLCPMAFRYPKYAEIIKDELFFDVSLANECWFDISVPSLNAKIHCSYYPLGDSFQYDKLISDVFKLAGKHTIKANYIDEIPFRNKCGSAGFIFALSGS